jgi:hypothetical protein
MGRILAALAAALLGVLAGAASAADEPKPPKTLPPGSTIAGVAVGELGPKRATAALRDALGRQYERRIHVRGRGRKVVLTTQQAGHVIHYDRMVRAAFEQAAASNGMPVAVKLDRSLDRRRVGAAVALVDARIRRPPRNASVRYGLLRPSIRKPRNGLGADRRELRRSLINELLHPHEERRVRVDLVRLRPAIGIARLRRIHHTYISVHRSGFRLRLFKNLRRVRTYGIAVGRAGFGTPGGLFRVQGKAYNPSWHVPNSPWAGSLRGQTIPPGDPRNPLRVVFMSLGGSIGIHGTSEPWSIGSRASHGCIRMRSGDVRNLASRTPVGTPVLIR